MTTDSSGISSFLIQFLSWSKTHTSALCTHLLEFSLLWNIVGCIVISYTSYLVIYSCWVRCLSKAFKPALSGNDNQREKKPLVESDSSAMPIRKDEVLVPKNFNDYNGRVINAAAGLDALPTEEILSRIKSRKLRPHSLESHLSDKTRAVHIRRIMLLQESFCDTDCLNDIPYKDYEYEYVTGSCCENVIGYVPLPLGYAGPLLMNGREYIVPLATTEGCLVASTSRGCRAIKQGSGVDCSVKDVGMSRGPVLRMSSAKKAMDVLRLIDDERRSIQRGEKSLLKRRFDSDSRYTSLKHVECRLAGRLVFLRFVATTGDAMGMNMVSKATEKALGWLKLKFPDMEILSLSGNYCADKKSTALNWIEGRGKSVVAEATVPQNIVESILKCSVDSLVELNTAKNLVGSALAGSVGGNNAHSANIVTAIFLATGQDAAQNVSSSFCITLMEKRNEDLYVTCTMPCLEVGTVGGGTLLPAQQACLKMVECAGGDPLSPGRNAEHFAQIICSTVLAGELSLLAALVSGDLVKSHLKYNRSCQNLVGAAENSSLLNQNTTGSELLNLENLKKLAGVRSQSELSSLGHSCAPL